MGESMQTGTKRAIMKKCRRLKEYSIFVARIRKYQGQGYAIERAIDRAVDECIQEGILAELLRSEREEVRSMLLTEYDEQAHIESERKIAAEEAYALGVDEGAELYGVLTQFLLRDSRIGDLEKASHDKEYRRKLYEEYAIQGGMKK